MHDTELNLCLVGCGKMGKAMVSGWRALSNLNAEIVIIDPAFDWSKALGSTKTVSIRYVKDASELPKSYHADIIILAVKPQIMDKVLPQVAPLGDSQTSWLSIAAGISTARLAFHLGSSACLMRAMPNTPAAIGAGITALYCSDAVAAGQKELAESLLQACGDVVHIEDEGMMDAVTAVSGSGPAYVYLLAEVMADAGHRLGLPEDVAQKLARQTVSGSGAILAAETLPASILRENVTSEGGTTFAALSVLMAKDGMADLFMRALEAAAMRATELDNRR